MMARTKTMRQATQAVLEGTDRNPNEFHWADPLFPPFVGRSTPHRVALTYEEWLVYHSELVRTGLWQH